MSDVRILDTVVLRGADVDAWTAAWRHDYLPGAVQRGLTLVESWREHVDTDAIAVHTLWKLPGAKAFFGMRAAAGADPAVAAFWADTDALAVRRTRHVGLVDTPEVTA